MATYTKSKLCSLVIKDTNALWIPMHLWKQNLCSCTMNANALWMQCTMNANALSHQLSWSYGDIYNMTKSKSMFSPSWGAYILRMSVLYCNSESNLMATYTKSKLCSLVIKDTNALWIPMQCQCTMNANALWMPTHYHTSYPEVMVTYTTWQSQNLCSALVEVHTY